MHRARPENPGQSPHFKVRPLAALIPPRRPRKVTARSRVLGVRTWTSLRGHVCSSRCGGGRRRGAPWAEGPSSVELRVGEAEGTRARGGVREQDDVMQVRDAGRAGRGSARNAQACGWRKPNPNSFQHERNLLTHETKKKRGQEFLQLQLRRGSEAVPTSPCLFISSFPLCAGLAPADLREVVTWQQPLRSHGPGLSAPGQPPGLVGVTALLCPPEP